jgi:hypothetical protein
MNAGLLSSVRDATKMQRRLCPSRAQSRFCNRFRKCFPRPAVDYARRMRSNQLKSYL